eukprot:TRINITY_DN5462_c1_g4_i1.p1 TRINITY_DN5462_c1_g4~~TRINITY_DN5462_c1_g4_i1.p1  ORF type:complete len:203 (+),score=40.50 TRINITY_DN5462_c1_g4_i1:68-610(+)
MALYGWALLNGAGVRVNREHGTPMLRQSKHVIARAFCLLYGLGVKKDPNEAYRLLSTECDTSDPHVQYLLGWCHSLGHGCTRSEAQVVQWCERAGNHLGALSYLAFLLEAPGADRPRALALYTRAATLGDAVAQHDLGFWYEDGMPGVLEKDVAQAKHWYTLSAEQGYEEAEDALDRLED